MSSIEPPQFDFDAMLMYGWVADCSRQVRSVNASLEKWLKKHKLGKVLDKIRTDQGLSIKHFFQEILHLDADACDLICDHLKKIPEQINPPKEQIHQSNRPGLKVETEITLTQNGKLLVGVRAMALGGFPMASENLEDRVDLITVCHTKYDGTLWHVTGYQGQLQSAWMRVSPIVREGTKAGAVALMGRNLSHNIGSHALYWMEQDEQDAGGGPTEQGIGSPDSVSRFYRYLRERMELLAGFATYLPLSPRTVTIEALISDFMKNKELTTRLCRSEKVNDIQINLRTEIENLRVSVPGGAVGMQAFHSILENIIRDCAKYGNPPSTMEITVFVNQPEGRHADDFLQVRVVDVCGVKSEDPEERKRMQKARDRIREELADLRIADEDGFLIQHFWGVKERFIAAALLRGFRVEDRVPSIDRIRISDTYHPKSWNLNTAPDGEPPILSLASLDHAIGWEFYLLKAQEVLLIGGDCRVDLHPAVNHRGMSWLKSNIHRPSAILHRFTALLLETSDELEWLAEHRDSLPFRTFAAGSQVTEAFLRDNHLCGLDPKESETFAFDPDELARLWLRGFDQGIDTRFVLLKNGRGLYRADWNEASWSSIKDKDEFYSLMKNSDCLGMFHRHWDNFDAWYTPGPHCEVYQGGDSLAMVVEDRPDAALKHTLFESALIRVLLVDERMDERAEVPLRDHLAPARMTLRERFAMKGITIHGLGYSGQDIPDKTHLLRWAGESNYHFISIHRGILDKLEKIHSQGPSEICEDLRRLTPNLLVHSGRAGSVAVIRAPRHIPLSNVSAWLDGGRGKCEVVDELCLVRRTS